MNYLFRTIMALVCCWVSSQNGRVPKRPCPKTAVSQNGRVPKRPCPKTAVSQNGRVPKRPCPKTAVSQNGRVPKRPCVDQSGNLLVWNCFDYWFTHGRFGTRPFWERPFWHVPGCLDCTFCA